MSKITLLEATMFEYSLQFNIFNEKLYLLINGVIDFTI